MRTKQILLAIILVPGLFGCDKEEEPVDRNFTTTLLFFTECNTSTKSTASDIPSIRLSGQSGDKLLVQLVNTEFCCGTDSISINCEHADQDITLGITDHGPFTWCFCPHDVEFSTGPLNNTNYNLTFIESVNSYSRDTFFVSFSYSQQLDTTITGENSCQLCDNPINYSYTIRGGCNDIRFKSATIDNEPEPDTVIFYELTDTLRIFVGLNLTCCIDFDSESSITGDTLVMRILTMNDDFCDCICYYTFDYYYSNYTAQGFYYQFFVDDYKRFEGTYNLP